MIRGRKTWNMSLWLAGAAIVFWAPAVLGATVNVFAAASLAESLREIAAVYQAQETDRIRFNFAGSGTLARQIEEGAPADLFFSADEARADALQKKGLLVPETRQSRLGNLLVIIVAAVDGPRINSPHALAEPAIKRLGLGDPKLVPAGAYAQQYLTRLNLWTAIQPKVVPLESVRSVLAAVESGNVDAGLVYQTDAAISKKVKVALVIPPDAGLRIRYPMALVKGAKEPAAARKFLRFLASEQAGSIFERHGFRILKEPQGP